MGKQGSLIGIGLPAGMAQAAIKFMLIPRST